MFLFMCLIRSIIDIHFDFNESLISSIIETILVTRTNAKTGLQFFCFSFGVLLFVQLDPLI